MTKPQPAEEHFPPITVDSALWRLDSDHLGVQSSADAWRKMGKAGVAVGDQLVESSRGLLSDGVAGSWTGKVRDSFARHQSKLVNSLDGVQARAEGVARELDSIAALLRHYQTALDDRLDALTAKVLCLNNPRMFSSGPLALGMGELVFVPKSRADVAAVHGAVRQAQAWRKDVEEALRSYITELERAQDSWRALAARWRPLAEGLEARTFRMPAEVSGTMVIVVDGRAVVNTGPGNDNVKLSTDPATGQVVIDVNGVKHFQPHGTEVIIRGGEGNDTIEVATGTLVKITLLAGAGDDRIQGGDDDETILGGRGRDRIKAGGGADYVSGGAGNDYLDGQGSRDRLAGGAGNDTVYGLDGSDYLSGGTGRDYLEGGRGDDVVAGGDDSDVVSGGLGDDRLGGGLGDDVLYAGQGIDRIVAGGGADISYQQAEDRAAGDVLDVVNVEIADVAGFVKIDGSPEFTERVLDDLRLYEASPTGQKMLGDLNDRAGFMNELTIREWGVDNGEARNTSTQHFYGRSNDSEIVYNLGYTFDKESGRPVIVLYHEFGHIYSHWHGILEDGFITGGPDMLYKKAERQATGLPFDHDGNTSTAQVIDPRQQLPFTENGLRNEMRHRERDTYVVYPGDGW